MATKKSVSSRHEKRLEASELFTSPLTSRERAELQTLAKLPDAEIDVSDAPAKRQPPAKVIVGRFYRPVKEQISLRVDADVLAWLRAGGRKYQTYINEVLRREMQARLRSK